MKLLGKLKLNEFRKAELEKRELNILKGGCSCEINVCSCSDSNENTSSNTQNPSGYAY